MDSWEQLAIAIENRQQVIATYAGRRRAFCPHALGHKAARRHVLAYQFDAERALGEPPTTGWRCLDVDQIDDIEVRDGEWHTAANIFNPQSCLDTIDVEVRPFPPYHEPVAPWPSS